MWYIAHITETTFQKIKFIKYKQTKIHGNAAAQVATIMCWVSTFGQVKLGSYILACHLGSSTLAHLRCTKAESKRQKENQKKKKKKIERKKERITLIFYFRLFLVIFC